MRRIFFAFIALCALTGCQPKLPQPIGPSETKNNPTPTRYVEVLFFHTRRNFTDCVRVKTATNEVLDENFTKQLEKGEVTFQSIDLNTSGGNKTGRDYGVNGPALFVNLWNDGKEEKYNITSYAFKNTQDSMAVLKNVLKQAVGELLHGKPTQVEQDTINNESHKRSNRQKGGRVLR